MNENIVLNDSMKPVPPQQNEIKLVDIPIRDENTALNVMVNFLSLAQKRGTFSIDESAKIWECIKMFQKA
jgi:hypothetical protein